MRLYVAIHNDKPGRKCETILQLPHIWFNSQYLLVSPRNEEGGGV